MREDTLTFRVDTILTRARQWLTCSTQDHPVHSNQGGPVNSRRLPFFHVKLAPLPNLLSPRECPEGLGASLAPPDGETECSEEPGAVSEGTAANLALAHQGGCLVVLNCTPILSFLPPAIVGCQGLAGRRRNHPLHTRPKTEMFWCTFGKKEDGHTPQPPYLDSAGTYALIPHPGYVGARCVLTECQAPKVLSVAKLKVTLHSCAVKEGARCLCWLRLLHTCLVCLSCAGGFFARLYV